MVSEAVRTGRGLEIRLPLPPQYSQYLNWTQKQIIAPKMSARDPLSKLRRAEDSSSTLCHLQYSQYLNWTRRQIIAPKMGVRDPLFGPKMGSRVRGNVRIIYDPTQGLPLTP